MAMAHDWNIGPFDELRTMAGQDITVFRGCDRFNAEFWQIPPLRFANAPNSAVGVV